MQAKITAPNFKENLENNGGFSLGKDGEAPMKGYMVAICDTPMVLESVNEVCDTTVLNYMLNNFPNAGFFGGWVDTETSKVYIEPALNVLTIQEAVTLGEQHDQIAIWDVENCHEVRLK